MTQRIELFFSIWLKELKSFFKIWLYNWSFFLIKPFLNMTQRIELFLRMWFNDFFKKKNKTLSIEPFFNLTPRIEPFWKIWLTEWNPFFWYYSKNWTIYNIWLQELNIFSIELFSDMTQRIELFLHMTQRIELVFEKKNHDSKKWTFCFGITQRIEPLKKQISDSKSWTFF